MSPEENIPQQLSSTIVNLTNKLCEESRMYISVDFDGTVVKHRYPAIGPEVPLAISTLKMWVREGRKLILNTMRSGMELDDAVAFLIKKGVTLYGVNRNPTQDQWTSSPKVYAHVYVDDAAYGCPLVHPEGERPYVDWSKIKLLP